MPDHVHMLISIPPKYSVAQVIGYIKGKSAIHVARTFFDHKRNFVGQHLGHAGTSCRRWRATRRRSANTSATRGWRTSGRTD
jgi:REP-associated tyrosine transposase